MGPRTRTRTVQVTGYRKNTFSGPTTFVNRFDSRKTISDVVGYREIDNPLQLSNHTITGSKLNGNWGGAVGRQYLDCPSNFNLDSPFISYLGLDTSDDAAWQRACALSNPSRPSFGLPTFLGELKDLPGMLHQTGRFAKYLSQNAGVLKWDGTSLVTHLINTVKPTPYGALKASQKVASANLAIQFGWAPLVSDLVKIKDFMLSLDKRKKELDRLYGDKGLKRRMECGSVNETSTETFACDAAIPFIQEITHNRVSRRWAVIHWKLTNASPPIPSGVDLQLRLAGITTGAIAETLWELLPWSWLVDYFSSIGNIVKLTNNHLAARASGTIMTHSSVISTHSGNSKTASGVTYTLSSGVRTRETKTRVKPGSVALPQFGVPFLGAKQSSILASLAVTRIR